jgi:hypothetical protein
MHVKQKPIRKITPNMSEKQKARARVLVAKDVIAQLKQESLVATTGEYIFFGFAIDGSEDFQKALKDTDCEVCAIGACFVSAVRRFDAFKLSEGYYSPSRTLPLYQIKDYLQQVFTAQQLSDMEALFEGFRAPANAQFEAAFPDKTHRMTLIMKNIIDNKGDLVVEQLYKMADEKRELNFQVLGEK